MESSSNNSFIPKRGPANRPKRVASRQVYFLTIISYVFFVATLLAALGVFLYQGYVQAQLEGEVAALNTELDRFNESDMEKVRSFEQRLKLASNRIENSVSISSVLSALEKSTAATVMLNSLSMTRNNDSDFELVATVKTDDFDSSLFQRQIFEQNSAITSVEFSDLDISDIAPSEINAFSGQSSEVTFTAVLKVPVSAVPYVATSIPEVQPEIIFDDIVPVEEVLDETVSPEETTLPEEIPVFDAQGSNNEIEI